MKTSLLFISIITLSLLGACTESALFQNQLTFEELQWSEKDALELDFEIEDASTEYDLDLFINHKKDYSYQNIYLKIQTFFPNGESVENLLPVNLADKFGQWHGKCSSENCKLRVFLRQDFKFKEAGMYKIVLTQHSREEELKGINNVKVALYLSK